MTVLANSGMPSYLVDYVVVNTMSMEEAHDAAARSFVPHKLTKMDLSTDFHFVHSDASMRDVSLCYTSYGSNVCIEPEPMEDFYLLQIPRSGRVEVNSGSHKLTLEHMHGATISPARPTQFKWSKDAGLVTIKINRSAIERHLKRMCRSEINSPLSFDIEMPLHDPKYRNWYIEVMRLMQHVEQAKHSDGDSLETWFEQKLMEMFLLCQPHNYSSKLLDCTFTTPSKPVGQAIDFMHAHLDKKIGLADLADVSGISARSLHNGFKRFQNLSPMDYLLEARLSKARRKLLHGRSDDTVTSIANAVGFTHLGRFASKYHHFFGEYPSETIKRRSKFKF